METLIIVSVVFSLIQADDYGFSRGVKEFFLIPICLFPLLFLEEGQDVINHPLLVNFLWVFFLTGFILSVLITVSQKFRKFLKIGRLEDLYGQLRKLKKDSLVGQLITVYPLFFEWFQGFSYSPNWIHRAIPWVHLFLWGGVWVFSRTQLKKEPKV